MRPAAAVSCTAIDSSLSVCSLYKEGWLLYEVSCALPDDFPSFCHLFTGPPVGSKQAGSTVLLQGYGSTCHLVLTRLVLVQFLQMEPSQGLLHRTLFCLLVCRFDIIASDRQRKLNALALCVLLHVQLAPLMQRLGLLVSHITSVWCEVVCLDTYCFLFFCF